MSAQEWNPVRHDLVASLLKGGHVLGWSPCEASVDPNPYYDPEIVSVFATPTDDAFKARVREFIFEGVPPVNEKEFSEGVSRYPVWEFDCSKTSGICEARWHLLAAGWKRYPLLVATVQPLEKPFHAMFALALSHKLAKKLTRATMEVQVTVRLSGPGKDGTYMKAHIHLSTGPA